MSTPSLRTTPLHDWHVAHGGRMVDFAGWAMPVQYTTIVQEHTATRTSAGLFDISHMGRFRLDGPEAAPFLDRLLTRRVLGMPEGKVRYALVTNEQGGILDDVLVYHLRQAPQQTFYLLVVNAGNREKIAAWIERHTEGAPGGRQAIGFHDWTEETAMIAVQGPAALSLVQPLLATNLSGMGYYTSIVTQVGSVTAGIVSRTGYTGEDGCELIVPAGAASEVWEQILTAGGQSGAQAAGLGARDTLRLEAAMPLYGHELSEQINPFQAGLGFAVNLENREFIGRQALERLKAEADLPRRIGLEFSGRRVPREHYPILAGEQVIGEVTSGTFSPTLDRPLAMGYVRPQFAQIGTELAVDIRGRHESVRVVKLPFYTRSP